MGEPGTQELLSLDELEAAGGMRTGRKHVLSIMVENKPGVLTRIAGLFARRGFNIDTLAVGPTEDERVSRITMTLDGALHPMAWGGVVSISLNYHPGNKTARGVW